MSQAVNGKPSPASEAQPTRGRCACGALRFVVRGSLRPVIYCHCDTCRRVSGHFVAATACAREHLELEAAHTLRWFQSSPAARRGFCGSCGSALFWDHAARPTMSIMAGSVEKPTGLTAREHIFLAEAGDYYTIADGLPTRTEG